ncbi:MAG: RIP metalloprotease RseP [Pseudomonadota bacterium]|nr:RIP metalloprotease RseP [Pseudomonadota bacterium]MDE3037992.1 RIP metalloprotease RseP [Pseudomonadota bacterium]
MELALHILHTLWSFFIVLSVVVFIHEFGHYVVARLCGVKIEAFSIGFGKELLGWNDRSGTRWKISALPLGGYVKMFGDASAASTADTEALENMSEADRKQTFYHKTLPGKAAIVTAGPAANFLLTIIVFTYFIMTVGLPSAEPVVGAVMPRSPAQSAGLETGDRILKINDDEVSSFNDIPYLISTNLGTPVVLSVERGKKIFPVRLTPEEVTEDDGLGNKIKHPLIGIKSVQIKYEDVGLAKAIGESTRRTYMLCASTLKVIGQIITGRRGAGDLKGPIGIAQLSGEATGKDFHTVLWLIAMLSANLGLVNLFPIPVLDGGHLAYYAIEAASGRPLAQKVQDFGFRIGFALLAMLMAFTVINDVRRLF